MRLLESAIGIIAPPLCVECGAEGSALCRACMSDIEVLPAVCYRCSALSPTGVCQKCSKTTRLNGVYFACLYAGAFAKLVRELKYGHNRSAVEPMVEILRARLSNLGDCIVVSVPTIPKRVRSRGFDHTRHLAKSFAFASGLPYSGILNRTGSARQVGKPKSVRLTQLNGNFWVERPYLIYGQNVLVIDDVITTGGTMDEAARALKRAGAKKVIGLSFAHKKLN